MQTKDSTYPSKDKNDRRRGRPAGKNRIPLSIEERRARNAQYERERRNETAEAMAQLAEACSCDPQITHPELLATVINRLDNANRETENIEDIKRINEKIESQIAALQSRLECDGSLQETNIDNDTVKSGSSSSFGSDSDSDEDRPIKYLKTEKQTTVHTRTDDYTQSSRQSESSTDSKDSVWSHHQLGKTAPKEMSLLSMDGDLQLDCNSVSSTHFQKTESVSECDGASSESEFYSGNSKHSEAYPEHTNQNVDVEFQLVSAQDKIKSERVENQPEVGFIDPFTEREKLILERLGCSDFLNFDDHHDPNQSKLIWPLDCDSLTGY